MVEAEAEAAGASFFYVCFEGAKLLGADLTNTNLSYTQMECADLRRAMTESADFKDSTNFIGLTDEQWLRLWLLSVEELDTNYAILIERLRYRQSKSGNH
jgi:uncharacterized protein YjbI with pentapeptide repeats